jgi:site-specific DNA-methyltransferase (adenine-specific)
MDEIFGKNNFRNEIAWCYKSRPQSKKYFGKKHDIILFYTKSERYTFHWKEVARPLSESTVKKYKLKDEAGRLYRLQGRGIKGSPIQSAKDVDPKWEKSNPELVVRDYLDSGKGVALEDWWEIDIINQFSKERTGYPTQKPLALLRRIIQASSNAGDVVFDPFCGCATACVAAQQLDRNWIGIDIEKQAVKVLIDRLSDDAGLFSDFVATKIPPKRTDIKEEPINQPVKERLYRDQKGACRACGVEMDIHQFEIDHIIPKAKGGGDYYENYQLLCPHCNRTKGDRPMEYLRMKIKHREEMMKTKIVFGE